MPKYDLYCSLFMNNVFPKGVSAKCNTEQVKFKRNQPTTSSDIKMDIQNHTLNLIFKKLQYL